MGRLQSDLVLPSRLGPGLVPGQGIDPYNGAAVLTGAVVPQALSLEHDAFVAPGGDVHDNTRARPASE